MKPCDLCDYGVKIGARLCEIIGVDSDPDESTFNHEELDSATRVGNKAQLHVALAGHFYRHLRHLLDLARGSKTQIRWSSLILEYSKITNKQALNQELAM